ncbi:MAG: tRNA (adenosine(37)-N6)-threonylcarbamoyltransferase complex dimerization subunit type 1 TsaB [Acidobacteriaceae bacterium]
MLLLLVDTAGTTGGILLAQSDSELPTAENTRVLGAASLPPRESSIRMIPAIADLLQASHYILANVDAFAVVSGPGSFTGLRVGLSAVKAMAEATGKPIAALSRLAVLASTAGIAETVHAVLDAGRGEFYHGMYRDGDGTCIGESLETLSTLVDSLQAIPGKIVASEQPVLNALAEFAPNQIPEVSVQDALPLALAAWQSRRFTDVALLDANYLRRHDVEMPPKRASQESAGTRRSES